MGDREPTRAEQARGLVERCRAGVLSVNFYKDPGQPYGSMVGYATDSQGMPLFYLTALAAHTKSLDADARASLTVVSPQAEGDPLDSPRVTLIGKALPLPEEEFGEAKRRYLGRFPGAEMLFELDFSFYRLEISSIQWVGGFGGAGWPTVSDYSTAGTGL